MPTPQPNDRPDRIPEPKPENARQTVALVRDDHRWLDKPLDLNSTDGIKRNIEALWSAIHRLAGYIDGDKPDTHRSPDRPYQAPVQPNAAENRPIT